MIDSIRKFFRTHIIRKGKFFKSYSFPRRLKYKLIITSVIFIFLQGSFILALTLPRIIWSIPYNLSDLFFNFSANNIITYMWLIFNTVVSFIATDIPDRIETKRAITVNAIARKDIGLKVGEEIDSKKLLNHINSLTKEEQINLVRLWSMWPKSKIDHVYSPKNDKQAKKLLYDRMYQDFLESDELIINSIAQWEFIGKFYDKDKYKENDVDISNIILNVKKKNPKIKIKVMLLYPYGGKDIDSLIKKRIRELEGIKVISKQRIERYKYDIDRTAAYIKYLKYDEKWGKKINLVFFDDEPIFRYYISSSFLYLTYYTGGKHGHENILFVFKRGIGSMYESFYRLFNYRWERFKNVYSLESISVKKLVGKNF